MTAPARQTMRHPPPPHLTMDEYIAWIQASLKQVDPVKAARQKALQEHITTRFQLKEAGDRSPRVSLQDVKRELPVPRIPGSE